MDEAKVTLEEVELTARRASLKRQSEKQRETERKVKQKVATLLDELVKIEKLRSEIEEIKESIEEDEEQPLLTLIDSLNEGGKHWWLHGKPFERQALASVPVDQICRELHELRAVKGLVAWSAPIELVFFTKLGGYKFREAQGPTELDEHAFSYEKPFADAYPYLGFYGRKEQVRAMSVTGFRDVEEIEVDSEEGYVTGDPMDGGMFRKVKVQTHIAFVSKDVSE